MEVETLQIKTGNTPFQQMVFGKALYKIFHAVPKQ